VLSNYEKTTFQSHWNFSIEEQFNDALFGDVDNLGVEPNGCITCGCSIDCL
jgi:hypothetical protein